MLPSRNNTAGFARRTRKNLMKVIEEFEEGEDFHVITQLVNSLLGIVVVPSERYSGTGILSQPLDDLHRDGWPKWNILLDLPEGKLGKTEKLDVLVFHLRNGAAHGRFSFGGKPESRKLEEVWLVVEDKPGRTAAINWRAKINGKELLKFCLKLCDLIDDPSVNTAQPAG